MESKLVHAEGLNYEDMLYAACCRCEKKHLHLIKWVYTYVAAMCKIEHSDFFLCLSSFLVSTLLRLAWRIHRSGLVRYMYYSIPVI